MVVEMIHCEKKYYVLLGDFNFLKFESNPSTEKRVTYIGTCYSQLLILQPTRKTDHSAILIDNFL